MGVLMIVLAVALVFGLVVFFICEEKSLKDANFSDSCTKSSSSASTGVNINLIGTNITELDQNVTITFANNNSTGNNVAHCVWWDESLNQWNTDGCFAKYNLSLNLNPSHERRYICHI